MTNGEKIQQDFDCEVCEPIIEDNIIHVVFADKNDSAIGFDWDWWNMEYKKPTTENDLGVLDKIRAEILGISSDEGYELGNVKDGYRIAMVNVLNIIDKYKTESEDKDYEAKVITRGNCMMCGKELTEGLFFCKECETKAVQGRK